MTITAWRIVFAEQAKQAFDGEGARRYGGRWNPKGVPMVYTAAHASLAVLELLVHVNETAHMRSFNLIPIDFDEAMCTRLSIGDLPRNWRDQPFGRETQEMGRRWLEGGESAALAVPSVIIPSELNYLINPRHPDFKRFKIGKPETFEYDARLMKQ
ncbi:MAG: RES domain-containing protein [bacterium]|nr:RES domain-containing protein [bacterium]